MPQLICEKESQIIEEEKKDDKNIEYVEENKNYSTLIETGNQLPLESSSNRNKNSMTVSI